MVGWGGVLLDRKARGRMRFYGGMSSGTVYVAEIQPYIQALRWYAERRSRLLNAARSGASSVAPPAVVRVHIVTDSSALAADGNALADGTKGVRQMVANRADWAALETFAWEGFVLRFHWIPRASAALNCWADGMARNCFEAMKAMPPPSVDGQPIGVYDCNADDDDHTVLHFIKPKQGRPKPGRNGHAGRACSGDLTE